MSIDNRWWNTALESDMKVVLPLVKSSIQSTCTHRNVTETQTIIVYAWNECSENGAALIPSLGNGNTTLELLLVYIDFSVST